MTTSNPNKEITKNPHEDHLTLATIYLLKNMKGKMTDEAAIANCEGRLPLPLEEGETVGAWLQRNQMHAVTFCGPGTQAAFLSLMRAETFLALIDEGYGPAIIAMLETMPENPLAQPCGGVLNAIRHLITAHHPRYPEKMIPKDLDELGLPRSMELGDDHPLQEFLDRFREFATPYERLMNWTKGVDPGAFDLGS